MGELRPLATPDQDRHVQRIVQNYVKVVKKAELLRKQYIEAQDAWLAAVRSMEEGLQEMSKYVSEKRLTVAVIIEEGAFVIRYRPEGDTASIECLVSHGGGEVHW